MAGFRRGGLVLKPLVAMVALANAQIALGCDDILVNAVTDVGGSPDLTTLDEALDAIGACAGGESVQVTIDDSLAGQTLTPIGGMTRSVDSSKQVSITGPSTNLVIVSVDDATWNLRVAESASMELNNLKFVGNPATTRSNALVRVSTNSTLNLNNVEISGFHSNASWISAVLRNFGITTIDRSDFSDNQASNSSGGAIYNDGLLTVRESTFSGNSASGRGGAIESWDAELVIEDSVFEGNVATTDNDSGVAGGALSLVGEAGAGVSTISGSVFRSNQARNYGGAIFQSSGDRFEVEDTLFEDNQVFAAANEYGGGASAEAHGGAVTVDRSTEVIIQRSEFLNNSATNYGGALYVGRSGRGGTVEIADSTFEGNQAKISSLEGTLALGGGIYADGPTGDAVDFSLIRSTLSGNSAEGAGGALYASGADLTVTIASSTLDGNSSASGGGAVHLRGVGGSSLAIEHSTITGNQVTGTAVSDAAALYADGPGAIDITHTVIAGNTQGGAGAGNICVGESSVQPGLVYSFWDNSFNADGCNQPLADASNILDETDPGLTDLADNGGYTLTRYPTEGSPLINAGNPNIMAEPDTDQRGSCRVVGGVIDIGAVEFGNHGAVAETLDDQTLSVGQSLILDASQVFSDPEGDALSYELIGAPLGITIDSTSGVISGEPSVAGEFPIEVIATDPCGASASATMSVTVKAAASSDSSGGGGGSMGYFIALLASLVWWRRLRR